MKIINYLFFNIILSLIICRPFDWAEIDNVQHGSVDLLVQTPPHIFNDGSTGPRFINQIITFATPYAEAPLVAVGINKIKCYQNSVFNIAVIVLNRNTNTFTVQVRVKDNQQCDFLQINYISIPSTDSRLTFRYFSEDISGKAVSDNLGSNRISELSYLINPNYLNIPILTGFSIEINDSIRTSLSLGLNSDKTKFTVSTSDNNQVKNIQGFQIEIIDKGNSDYGFPSVSYLIGSQTATTYTTQVLELKNTIVLPFMSYSTFDFDRSYPLVFQQGTVSLVSNQYTFKFGADIPSVVFSYGITYFNVKYRMCDAIEYLLNNTECVQTCPLQYYADTAQKICVQCHKSCLTCLNSNSENDCTSCDSTKDLISGTCVCKTGYFSITNDLSYTCYQCSYTCEECVDNADKCTKCGSNRSLDSTICKCKDGYWDSISSAFCPKCFRNCKTCSGGESYNCLTCISGYFLYSDGNCTCDYGFYDDPILNSCQECHSTCAKCSGKLETDCIECTSNRVLQFNKCVCPIGYSEQLQNGQLTCIPDKLQSCFANCKTCEREYYGSGDTLNYKSITKCVECEEDRELINGECKCLAGTYEVDNVVCFPCDKTCKTCYTEGINGCSSCDEYRQLREDKSCENIIEVESQSNSENLEAQISIFAIFSAIAAIFLAVYFHRKYEQRKLKYKEEFQQVHQDRITVKQPQKEKKNQYRKANTYDQENLLKINNNVLDELDQERIAEQLVQPNEQEQKEENRYQEYLDEEEDINHQQQNEKNQIDEDQQDEKTNKIKDDYNDDVEIVVDINNEN